MAWRITTRDEKTGKEEKFVCQTGDEELMERGLALLEENGITVVKKEKVET